MKKVGCVVLNYNDYKTTVKMVENIRDFKVIDYISIVDNMSTNESFNVLNDKFKKDPHIKVIKTKKDGGYGYGNNYGIRYLYNFFKCDYIIVSNPDVSFDENTISRMLKFMIEKNAAMVSATQKINRSVIENPAWKIPTALSWALVETTHFYKWASNKYYYPKSYFSTKYSTVDCVRGAMFIVNAQDFIDVGGYDERMFLFGEETLIGYKFKKNKYKVFLLNNEFYNHNHSTTINKTIPSVINQEKIAHKSKLIFIKYYLKSNIFTYLLIKFIFNARIVKMKLLSKVK